MGYVDHRFHFSQIPSSCLLFLNSVIIIFNTVDCVNTFFMFFFTLSIFCDIFET